MENERIESISKVREQSENGVKWKNLEVYRFGQKTIRDKVTPPQIVIIILIRILLWHYYNVICSCTERMAHEMNR